MTEEGLARRVELTGWSTFLLGLVCTGLAALEVAIPVLLRRLEESGGLGSDATLVRLRVAFSQGAVLSAAVNAVFGAALLVVGWGVARRHRWSHAGLTAVAWASIPAIAVLAVPGVAPVLALGESTAGSKTLLVLTSAVLLVLQVAGVLWFLRFWRRKDVHALFD